MTINNHEPSVHVANNTNLPWERANSNRPLFRVPATSSHGQENRGQLEDLSFIEELEYVLHITLN
jgi:hypothetical protein